MKTEDLQGKGLNQEQIDFVMSEHGKELNAVTVRIWQFSVSVRQTQTSFPDMRKCSSILQTLL